MTCILSPFSDYRSNTKQLCSGAWRAVSAPPLGAPVTDRLFLYQCFAGGSAYLRFRSITLIENILLKADLYSIVFVRS